MSRYRRSTNDLDADLAYGDYPPPNRWDRERFERTRVQEREREVRPARADVLVDDRRARYDDRQYDYPRERAASRIRREALDDAYARETSDRALLPYRGREEVERERDVYIDIERRREPAPPRPGLLRRQSSLDTFDRRRPHDRADYRGAVEPYRRRSPPRPYEEFREDIHIHRDTPLEHRDVEIYREREIRKRGRAKSDLKSVASSRTSTSRTSDSSTSRTSSPSPVRMPGKKGHTKLPKGKFARSAVTRFGVPFEEEGEFYRIKRALDKTSIDTILAWSREDRQPKVTTYSFEGENLAENRDHYEKIRTEWINPPSVRGASPARSQRTVRAPSPPPPPRQETKVVIEERVAAPPPQPVYIQSPPPVVQVAPPPPPVQPMALQITERTERTHGDIEAEIRRLELERELVHHERGGHHHHHHGTQLVVRQPVENYQVVEYSPRHRAKSMSRIEYVRDRSPPRNVVRIEKDRRGRMALVRSKN